MVVIISTLSGFVVGLCGAVVLALWQELKKVKEESAELLKQPNNSGAEHTSKTEETKTATQQLPPDIVQEWLEGEQDEKGASK